MNTIEITYRYDGVEASLRTRPADAEAARQRLNDGNRAFAELFTRHDEGLPVSRQVIPVDPRDLGLLPSGNAPQQRPFAAVLGCADARVPATAGWDATASALARSKVRWKGMIRQQSCAVRA